jgi:hypothetical protein
VVALDRSSRFLKGATYSDNLEQAKIVPREPKDQFPNFWNFAETEPFLSSLRPEADPMRALPEVPHPIHGDATNASQLNFRFAALAKARIESISRLICASKAAGVIGTRRAPSPWRSQPLVYDRDRAPLKDQQPAGVDKSVPSQVIELHSVPASQGRMVGYRIGEDQSGGNETILQLVGRCEGGRCLK